MAKKSKRPPRIRPSNKEGNWSQPQPIKDNGVFLAYYKAQGILPDEELNDLVSIMKTDLPTTFRINPNEPSYEVIKKRMQTEFQFDKPIIFEDSVIPNPFPISWYPDNGAWQINISRKKMRKCPELKSLHELLITLNESGQITRQEAVSMIPVLMLNPQPGDIILDMCAAPGSKTLQLLHGIQKEGTVIANDADPNRAYLLVHQTHRLHSPHLLVTTHMAQNYPDFLKIQEDNGVHFDSISDDNNYLYDRILCDVPCSGDGTLRKTPLLFNTFTPKTGRMLFPLQRAILYRGLSLLKVGGTLVYSTCSLNPIEDEAVVSSILSLYTNELEIVDMDPSSYDTLPEDIKGRHHMLNTLKRDPGINHWKVFTNQMKEVQHRDDISENERCYYDKSMFCPSLSILESIHINRCMRFYPQRQNTGGFFVCVIRKKNHMIPCDDILDSLNHQKGNIIEGEAILSQSKHISKEKDLQEALNVNVEEIPEQLYEKVTEEASQEIAQEIAQEVNEETSQQPSQQPSPLVYEEEKTHPNEERLYPWDEKDKQSLIDFYGITSSFDWTSIYSRSKLGRMLVYVTDSIKKLVLYKGHRDTINLCNNTTNTENNEDEKQISIMKPCSIAECELVHTGLRLFQFNTRVCTCSYRLCQESSSFIKPFITKRRIPVTKDDMIQILKHNNDVIPLADLPSYIQDILLPLDIGCCLFELDEATISLLSKQFPSFSNYYNTFACVVWKGRNNINLLATDVDIEAMLRALIMN